MITAMCLIVLWIFRNKTLIMLYNIFIYIHFTYIYIHLHTFTYILNNILFINIFIVELDQHLSMAVRVAPASKHFILQIWNTLLQNFIVSNKVFKELICFISTKVRLVGVAPHWFFPRIILHIFVQAMSNIFMVIMLQPFLERLESILLSLILSNTFEYWRSHDVDSVSTTKTLCTFLLPITRCRNGVDRAGRLSVGWADGLNTSGPTEPGRSRPIV